MVRFRQKGYGRANGTTMNSPITFPPPAPVLKLARPSAEKWAATLAEERRRLQEDHDALRDREANLRDYEARLRDLQAEIEASRPGMMPPSASSATRPVGFPTPRPSSRTPFTEDPAWHQAWEKLHRARELMEVEQAHLRDERIVFHDQNEEMKRREFLVAGREVQVAEREALVAAAEPRACEHPMSAMTRLTTAPFKMARSVFRGKH